MHVEHKSIIFIPEGTIKSTNRGNYPRPLWQSGPPPNYYIKTTYSHTIGE